MKYQEALQFLYERLPMFQRVGAVAFKKDLTNTLKLLDRLDNPHRSFKSVHIAGTNGKGSSAHALSAILQAAGYKTGLYTSPHLKSFTERIKIDGQEVSEAFVADFVTRTKPFIEEIKPSFFEVTVVMAFQFFKEQEVDLAVIETGLGGRLDSTNVITPLVSLITMIGNDHAEMLGDTLEQIAREKAGIIKPGVPVVIGANQPELYHVFKKVAEPKGSAITTCNHIEVSLKSIAVECQVLNVKWGDFVDNLTTDNLAAYFIKNVPGVLGTIDALRTQGIKISDEAVKQGLKNIKGLTGLKGRWQVLSHSPLVVADVSHNEPGLEVLFQQVAQVNPKTLHVVIGVVREKDLKSILQLFPHKAKYYFTQSSAPRSLNVGRFAEEAKTNGLNGAMYPEVNQAIAAAKKIATAEDMILICGSTFVVAEIEEL